MKFDTWFWRGTLAVAVICSTIVAAVHTMRTDPAEACRVQTLASEERINNRIWQIGHLARKDAAAIRSAIAKLPQHQHVNGLTQHWRGTVRADQ